MPKMYSNTFLKTLQLTKNVTRFTTVDPFLFLRNMGKCLVVGKKIIALDVTQRHPGGTTAC